MYLIKFILFFFLFSFNLSFCQNWETMYDNRLNSNLGFSYDKLKKVSKRSDAYNYIAIGYFLNANNLMFQKTKDEKYLLYNRDILKEMLLYINDDNLLKWKWEVKENTGIVKYVDNVVLEGYFYRYLGEYINILLDAKFDTQNIKLYMSVLQNGFGKWVKLSEKLYKDSYSSFFHIRIHIACNWGAAALYLHKFTGDKLYSDYLTILNDKLKDLFELKEKNNSMCYIWQSNYKDKFTVSLKTKNIGNPIIQDVGHANHVVNYIITSYELGYDVWSQKDIIYLSNTLKEFIWDENIFQFNDNVDGTESVDEEMRNQGWKQSDGWMKLIKYNKSLVDIYIKYHKKNSDVIYSSSMALQYYANLL